MEVLVAGIRNYTLALNGDGLAFLTGAVTCRFLVLLYCFWKKLKGLHTLHGTGYQLS